MTSELKILLLFFFFFFLVDDQFQTIGSENFTVGYQHLNTYKFRNNFLNYSPCDFNNILTNLTRTKPDLFTKLPILRTFYGQARIQDFLRGGGGGRPDCQQRFCFLLLFFFSPQLILQFYRGCPMVISRKL